MSDGSKSPESEPSEAGPSLAGDAGTAESPDDGRRRFLRQASRLVMAAGVAGSAAGFGAVAGRYLYLSEPSDRRWQFVAVVAELRVGESRTYRAPAGEALTVTRQARGTDAAAFTALSSTCPHLGCQVHWEPQNLRYFCPCHNGTFDASGTATGGPPFEAGQNLPRYPLRIEKGILFVEVPVTPLLTAEVSRRRQGS